MSQSPPRKGRSMHDVKQDDKPQLMKQDQQDKSFDLLEIKYLNCDNVKSVIFTILESSTSQRRAHITHKIDSGADGNLMPFTIFKMLFP